MVPCCPCFHEQPAHSISQLLKEDVRNCYLREGVNYIEKCEKVGAMVA